MQISVASSTLVSVPIIEAVLNSQHNLASIISNPDQKSGRGLKVAPNELAQWAQARDLPLSKPADNSELNRHLLTAQPQLVITAAYGKLIPVELLHGPRFGWLNLHFSLLPKWRGAAPVQWTLLSGEEETGISIFKLDKGMDTGPIYLQEKVAIQEFERTPELLARMSILGGAVIMSVVDEISKGIKPKAQPATGFTLAPKITKEMGQVQWDLSTAQILFQDRAIGDKPGIWSTFRGEKISLHGLTLTSPIKGSTKNGAIEESESGLIVKAGDGFISINEVTPAGKRRMKSVDFLRGARLLPGETLDVIG